MTAALRVERLRVTLQGRRILDVEAFELQPGELGVVSGGAGSGKTMLASALGGAVDSEGTLHLGGRPLGGPPSQRRRAGLAVAIRDGSRLAGCTVEEALRLAGRGARPHQALERFPALAGRRHVAAQLLSGGEQQMLQIACAWCAGARVLVLDSPTVGLAGDVAVAVSAMAKQEAEGGAAVLWLEQDLRAAPAPATHVLSRGTLTAAAAAPA